MNKYKFIQIGLTTLMASIDAMNFAIMYTTKISCIFLTKTLKTETLIPDRCGLDLKTGHLFQMVF